MEPLRNIAPSSVDQYVELDQSLPKGVKLEYFDGYLFCNGFLIDPRNACEEAVAMAGAAPRTTRLHSMLLRRCFRRLRL